VPWADRRTPFFSCCLVPRHSTGFSFSFSTPFRLFLTPDGYLYGELQRQPALCMCAQSILVYVFFGWMRIYILICSSACTRKTKSNRAQESVSTQGQRLRAKLRNIAMHIQHIICERYSLSLRLVRTMKYTSQFSKLFMDSKINILLNCFLNDAS